MKMKMKKKEEIIMKIKISTLSRSFKIETICMSQ